MSLTDELKKICDRLAPHGWRDLLLEHGLDITANDLKAELLKELLSIKRSIDGFSDFAVEGKRGIEPGNPARSLLFHALASPNVTKRVDGKEELGAFPTLAEIETVENYVYGVMAPTIQQLLAQLNQLQASKMSIVVFATEYRPASETVHKRHADMCFSRTGVARVGNTEPLYDARRRGFLPYDEKNDFAFRVLPAKYSAYIALQMDGDDGSLFGPMRFTQQIDPEDRSRKFWVPLHKLFDGDECIKGLDLTISLSAHHINEKIKRIHMQLQDSEDPFQDATLEKPPFKFTTGIAEFTAIPEFGKGLLVPEVHTNLIEAAEFEGKPLSFRVPKGIRSSRFNKEFLSSLTITSKRGERHAPEYVHVRSQQIDDATAKDLNDDENMVAIIRQGGYLARHFVDFTGDGWIKASCPQLNTSIPDTPQNRHLRAYSLVTAPDFYFNVDQGELMNWANKPDVLPLLDEAWADMLGPLSDVRLPANLELKDPLDSDFSFSMDDDTVTTVVSLPLKDRDLREFEESIPETVRHAYLPDAASGVFAPGWDVSRDNGHLAAYGLGSPFPEDSKLCAALSSFWPAVAPDASRSFFKRWPTVSPMTDEEIGQSGDRPWDGVTGPKIINTQDKTQIEYSNFIYADYVDNMLQKKFTMNLTRQVDIIKYESRILALAKAYKAIPKELQSPDILIKLEWRVISFKEISATDPELEEALSKVQRQNPGISHVLDGDIYKIEMYRPGNSDPKQGDFKKVVVDIEERITFFTSSGLQNMVLFRDEDGDWKIMPIQ